MYNLAFTSLPIILMGVLDQDVDDKVSLAVPQLYKRGIERLEWTQTKFWLYMVDGMYQSVLVFWSSYLLFAPATGVTWNGLGVDDIRRMGVYVAANAVLIVNAYVLFNTYRWDWLTLLIQFISTFFFFFWTGVWTSSTSSQVFYHGAAQVFGQLSFWVLLFVTVVICLLPRFAVKSMQKVYFPRDVDIIREQVNQGRFDYLKHSDDEFPRGPDAAPKPVATAESSASSHAAGGRRVLAARAAAASGGRRPPREYSARGPTTSRRKRARPWSSSPRASRRTCSGSRRTGWRTGCRRARGRASSGRGAAWTACGRASRRRTTSRARRC